MPGKCFSNLANNCVSRRVLRCKRWKVVVQFRVDKSLRKVLVVVVVVVVVIAASKLTDAINFSIENLAHQLQL